LRIAVVDKVLLDVAHHSQGEIRGEDTAVLPWSSFEDIRLTGPPDGLQHLGLYPLAFLDRGAAAVFGRRNVPPRSMAVLKKNASINAPAR
jgi:hypothetical protein